MVARRWFLLPLDVLLINASPLLTVCAVPLLPRVVLDVVAVAVAPPPLLLLRPRRVDLDDAALPAAPEVLPHVIRCPLSLRLGPWAKLPELLDAVRCALLAVSPGG